MKTLVALKEFLEHIGGISDDAPAADSSAKLHGWFWGIWWAALALIAIIFSGQTSKFIYIDF